MPSAAKQNAKRLFCAEGAFFSDISNLNGYNAIEPDTIRNCSVGAQIALDFYHYYKYTNDLDFLLQKAIPMMCACSDFYLSMLEDQDSCCRIRGGLTCFESYWNLKETLTDYASLTAVLKALSDIGETEGLSNDQLSYTVNWSKRFAVLPRKLSVTREQN